jgi:hypothetical protein
LVQAARNTSSLLSLLILATLSFSSEVRPLSPRSSADAEDLSDDARWDDGFSFGSPGEWYARVHSIAVVEDDVMSVRVQIRFGSWTLHQRKNTAVNVKAPDPQKWIGRFCSDLSI